MAGVVLTEPNPRSPEPVHLTGAWTPGTNRTDRGAEYGAPSMTGGVVAFAPQRVPGRSGEPGHDVPAPTLGDVIGRAPAIGVVRRP